MIMMNAGYRLLGLLAFMIFFFCAAVFSFAQVDNEGLRTQTGRWMEIPDNPTIALPVFTAECWVKCHSGGLIVTRDHPTGTPSDWQLWYDISQYRLAFITAATPPDSYFYTPPGSFLSGRWYHVALVVNGPAGSARLYIDGSLVIAPTFSPRNFDAATGLAWGGYFGNSSGAYLNGLFDEAKYWNLERTQVQIITTKDIAQPLNDRVGMMGYWRFCGDFADSSGNGNHGQARGGATVVPIPDLPFGIDCNPCITSIPLSIFPATVYKCIDDTVTLTASSGFVEYRWSNGASTRAIMVKQVGRYQVVARDANGCIAIAEVDVHLRPQPIVDAGRDTVLCLNLGSVQIGSPATGGTPPYRYSWTPPHGLDATNIAQPRASPVSSTVYRVLVTDDAGCTIEDSVQVEISPEMWLSLPDSLVICYGKMEVLPLSIAGGTPPYRITWSPPTHLSPDNIQNPLASPPQSTKYYVTVIDAAGCIAEDSIHVIVKDGLFVTATGGGVLCIGDSVQLGVLVREGTPPYRYDWRPPTGLSATDVASPYAFPTASGRYIVRVTDQEGCSAEDTLDIVVHPELDLSLPDTLLFCAGDTIRLPLLVSGGDGRYRYRWSPSQFLDDADAPQPVAVAPSSMTFRVIVSDGSGCVAEDSVALQTASGPEIVLPDTVTICPGTSVRLSVAVLHGRTPFRYRWTPAGTLSDSTVREPQASPTKPTTYRVVVTDASGCETEDSVHVNFFRLGDLELRAEGPTTVCDGDSVTLRASPGYAQYRWLLPRGQRTTDQSTIVVTEAGAYRVAVIDSNGCELLSNLLYINRPAPYNVDVTILDFRLMCEGDSVTLQAPPGYVRYDWTNETGTVLGHGRTYSAANPGRYIVTVKDSLGCIGRGDILVTQAEKPKPTIDGPRVVCINSTHRYISSLKPGFRYAWRVENGEIRDNGRNSTTSILWSELGVHRLTLWQTIDSSGCRDSITVTVRVIDKLDAMLSASGPRIFCEGDSVTLSVNGAFHAYVWIRLPADTLSSYSRVTVHESGRYAVRVFSSDGCSGISDTVEVRVIPRPEAVILGSLVVCSGDTAVYTAQSNGTSVRWIVTGGRLLDDMTSDTIRVIWDGPGAGTVRLIVEAEGQEQPCPAEVILSVQVGRADVPWVIAEPDSVICVGDSVVLTAEAGYVEYRWHHADGTVIGTGRQISVQAQGLYFVRVQDSLGCEASSAMIGVFVRSRPETEINGPASVCIPTEALYCVPDAPTLRYQWSVQGGIVNGPTDAACVSILWPSSGTWTLRVRVHDGVCMWEDSIIVTVADSLIPLIRASGPLSFCEGDTIWLDVGAGYDRYLWSSAYGNLTERNVPVWRSGRYTAQVWDADGCEGSAHVDVFVHPAPKPVILGPNAFCPGDSIELAVSEGYLEYRWSDGTRGPNRTVRSPGRYVVEVVDSNGCRGVSPPHDVVFHSVPLKPVIRSYGDTLVSTVADTYQWHADGVPIPAATDRRLVARQAAVYFVRVRNEYGCEAVSDPFELDAIHGVVTVRLPHIVALPGEVVRIPLTLIHTEQLDAVRASTFDAVIKLKRSVLQPIGTSALVSKVEGEYLLISLSGAYASGTTELAAFDMIATLGDTEITPLLIDSFDWHDIGTQTRKEHGSLRLLLCDEGGQRLFASNSVLSLKQNRPNPFNAHTIIEYSTVEKGYVQLFVLDALGRRVAVLAEEEKAPGAYSAVFDASRLPSGTYLCVLRTPSAVLYRRMLVVK